MLETRHRRRKRTIAAKRPGDLRRINDARHRRLDVIVQPFVRIATRPPRSHTSLCRRAVCRHFQREFARAREIADPVAHRSERAALGGVHLFVKPHRKGVFCGEAGRDDDDCRPSEWTCGKCEHVTRNSVLMPQGSAGKYGDTRQGRDPGGCRPTERHSFRADGATGVHVEAKA